MYNHDLLHHFQHSTYRGVLEKPQVSSGVFNPSCGDAISFQASVCEGMVTCARFQGSGCVISQAAASLLAEYIEKKSVSAILQLGAPDILQLLNLQLGPNRLRCAMLCLEALHEGLKNQL